MTGLLPNAEAAVVDLRKLRDYCLDSAHPTGRHKARVFRSALGLTDADAEALRERLLQAAHTLPAELAGRDTYGARYRLDFEMHGPGGAAIVRSAWIVRRGEAFPRLVSCYVI